MQNPIIIIGNSNIGRDLSTVIKSAARVVRFNGMPNRGGWSGYRTDDLWLCSTGRPGRGFAEMDCLRFLINESGATRLFTSTPPASSIKNLMAKLRLNHHQVNHAARILRRARRLEIETAFPGPDSETKLLHLLHKQGQPTPSFKAASTGIIAVHHYAFNPCYAEQEIVLAGFDFGGWRGHDWDRERHLVEQLEAAGRLRVTR